MTSNNDSIDNKLNEQKSRSRKFSFLILAIIFFILVVSFSTYSTMNNYRKTPKIESSRSELAVRGNIISQDGFNLVTSKKLYKAIIDTRYLDFEKLDLFVSLFSIYSGLDYKEIREKIESTKNKKSSLVLSYNIDSKTAKNLKELDIKLNSLKVFIPLKNDSSNLIRLDIIESGEKRDFLYDDSLSPILGYLKKSEGEDGRTKVFGVKGLERFYDSTLSNMKNGILEGFRDVSGYLYFDKDSKTIRAIDGDSLQLNIPLKLQKNNEASLDKHKERIKSEEILLAIVENKSGKVITLASSNRFDPDNIKQDEINYLNVNAIEYQFEPGSVIKPISISLAIDKNRVKKDDIFPTSNIENKKGKYRIGRYTISDSLKNFDTISLEDTIIYSSNIATLQIAQKIPAIDFYNGMINFGFTKKTGIDLPFEKTGELPELRRFQAGEKENIDNVFKATVAYGHGMTSTFMQLIKAFTVFNNDGYITTPKIVNKIINRNKNLNPFENDDKIQIISKDTALFMKNILIKTVEQGTGRGAKVEGIEVGGKTGTGKIAGGSSGYLNEYISSFIGFANDHKGNSYTIGVTVIKPQVNTSSYYAARTAVPIFKEAVLNLVKLNYLTPKKDIISQK
ncbi:Penicillin-binding protein 2B [Aliarcobacter thereius]|uniref:Penicillin-binding protein 2 n=1 Tax=Aliarcobacter thereius TaxID=544718 RepID=A0A5R9H342_9BACT|nr:penicillin-binding protein 2 [Aliarcobacter thereius]OCL85682.1 Penicillin-binding protein 2B [Aliarcobacter thereius]TLS71584.1 penicillin-binding protein 2 [Aliarcobacter thereius]